MVDGTGEFTGVLTLGSTINDLTLPTGTATIATEDSATALAIALG